MKRILYLLLTALLIASFGASASAAQKRKKTPQPQPQTTKEETFTAVTKTIPAPDVPRDKKQQSEENEPPLVAKPSASSHGNPSESHLTKARGSGKKFDLRKLPHTPPVARDRKELEPPAPAPILFGNPVVGNSVGEPTRSAESTFFHPVPNAPAPPPNNVFDGLDRFNWGAGSPPDTNGDVGPNHYIQTVNTSIGVFRKSDGFMEAAFTFDTFMSQGNFGNLCDTNNFGDPVVLYDTFEDRWIITDFAFQTDVNGNVLAPAYQCVAASMSGDPIAGGWNFYSIQISDFLNDYPKFGIWPDGLYMSANMFSFGAGSTFQGARVWAFDKAQMYAGSPTVKIVSFNVGGSDFTVIPSNARLQTGTPPPGRPNLFVSTWSFLNALTVYKFHVDWNDITLSTFTGPDTPLAATSWPNQGVANVPQSGTSQLLDALQIRAMVQNQYTNFGGTESLWVPHTVRRALSGTAAPRWYQVDVTGGSVNANLPQSATWDPDGANVMNRWMPSLALDRAGNMAMGYSTSNGSTFPSMKYAGRLQADPVNTFSLSEQTFFTGTASQLSSTRWGDYSSMTLDQDGCTFWYTNEYATGLDNTTIDPTSYNKRWQTKFGSFGPLPGCTPAGAGGTISGVVTRLSDASPIAGATVALGARSTTTDNNGAYAFPNLPAGIYPSMTASFAGFVSSGASNLGVTDGNTTTQNFALAGAPPSACLTDTTQSDFQTGVPTNTDLNASPGDVVLTNPNNIDQQNTTLGTSGVGITVTTWGGQTFTPAHTGQLVQVDLNLFCSGCTGTTPNLTLSVRNTSGGLPTGADLVSGTITGFYNGGVASYFTVTFGSPITLTAGTQYALVIRPTSNPSPGTYALTRSGTSTAGSDVYPGGTRVAGATSGTVWSIPLTGGVSTDAGFRIYINSGFSPSGTFVSSPKDANPASGITPIWGTFSWNATTPTNTSIKFQIAGSNDVNGPFNFVGPDGTSSTFFTTSPVQLSPQFYNFRYLEYEAILGTTDGTVTPALNDATLCFNDVDCSGVPTTITATPSQVCDSSAGNTAGAPPGMNSYSWGIANGTITSATNGQTITYTAGTAGTTTLTVTMTAPNGCIVTGSLPVTVNALPPKPTISGTLSFCTGNVTTLTSSAPGGNQWYLGGNPISGATNQTYDVSTAGSYTVQVTDPNNCVSPMSDASVVTQNTPPPTPTISADTNGTGTQDQACPEVPLTLHANGATGAVSYTWYKDIDVQPGETTSTYSATGAATYYVTATDANGCTTAKSAGYVVQNPTPHSPFISFRNQDSSITTLHICQGSSQIVDSDSATGIHWWVDGVDQGPGSQSYTFTSSTPSTHTFTAQLNALGCHSQFGRTVTIIVDAMPPTPTISGDTNGTGTQDQACPEQPLTLHANGATGATSYTWYTDNAVVPNENTDTLVVTYVANISVTATNGTCTTPHSATYVVQNPTPHAPFISFRNQSSSVTSLSICQGQSQIIDSDSATGIQWYKDGVAIPGAGNQSYTATQSGVYTAQLDALGCHSQFGRNVTLTVNPLPEAPTVTVGGPTTFCQGGSVTLTSSSASGNQWKLNGSPIGGATAQTYNATASGSYTVTYTDGNGCSATSGATSVTVNPLPATPTIGAGGPTTFCSGGSVTLTSSSASGNQWNVNGSPIGGATAQTYNATTSGSYTVTVTDGNGCTATSATTSVTVNPIPETPVIGPGGPTTFCAGGSVTLTATNASGNQWYLNGSPIGGATAQSYVAAVSGDYTVITTTNGCSSAVSAATTVTVNPNPNATITAPGTVVIASTGNSASVATAGAGATYNWSITNGTITGGTGTNAVTFTAGAVGTLTLQVTVTTSASCSDTKSVNVNVALPTVTVTSVVPATGSAFGGLPVTINGSGFAAGATVTFGGTAATNVVVVSATKITAKTPAHAGGAVNVKVTNTDTSNGTLTNGYTYVPQRFDPNNDGTIDPSDLFFLVNYLFTGGPAPEGPAGMVSGDANGDNVVDPSDIFFLVNYLYDGGARPSDLTPSGARKTVQPMTASVSLGEPFLRNGRTIIPVILTTPDGAETPRALSLNLLFNRNVHGDAVHRAGVAAAAQPTFEVSRATRRSVAYLVSYTQAAVRSGIVAEIEVSALGNEPLSVDVDPNLTQVSDPDGGRAATVANGHLQVIGTAVSREPIARPQGVN